MRRILNDNVQLVKIGRNTVLSPVVIQQAIQRAYSNKMYAKFYTDHYFIQVNFMRDGTISVASNIRNGAFLNDKWKKDQQGWTVANVKQFVYQWMQLSRRTLH